MFSTIEANAAIVDERTWVQSIPIVCAKWVFVISAECVAAFDVGLNEVIRNEGIVAVFQRNIDYCVKERCNSAMTIICCVGELVKILICEACRMQTREKALSGITCEPI
jgi:hypothetical protein